MLLCPNFKYILLEKGKIFPINEFGVSMSGIREKTEQIIGFPMKIPTKNPKRA